MLTPKRKKRGKMMKTRLHSDCGVAADVDAVAARVVASNCRAQSSSRQHFPSVAFRCWCLRGSRSVYDLAGRRIVVPLVSDAVFAVDEHRETPLYPVIRRKIYKPVESSVIRNCRVLLCFLVPSCLDSVSRVMCDRYQVLSAD